MNVQAVLTFLEVESAAPSPDYLRRLVEAYTRHVPWETAFRIARRASIPDTEECPRWPATFWQDAMHRGGGGTCYESNYAFFTLLTALGFEGYLTINDMNESQGCHSALVIEIDGQRWLTDVGIPLYAPIPLIRGQITQADSPFHTYTVTPTVAQTVAPTATAAKGDSYTISRDRHPNPYIFTLHDRPVTDAEYRAITAADYGQHGLFLDAVIIHRVMRGEVWRYNGRADPPVLERFGSQPSQQVMAGDAAPLLAELFEMDGAVLSAAFQALGR